MSAQKNIQCWWKRSTWIAIAKISAIAKHELTKLSTYTHQKSPVLTETADVGGNCQNDTFTTHMLTKLNTLNSICVRSYYPLMCNENPKLNMIVFKIKPPWERRSVLHPRKLATLGGYQNNKVWIRYVYAHFFFLLFWQPPSVTSFRGGNTLQIY